MINILRIISFIAAILAVVFFVFPILYGVDSDEQVQEFLKTPEIREKFENAADSRVNKNKDLTSPLVQQAMAFASYLNPKPTAQRSPTASRASKAVNDLNISPKFKLRCTSYVENDPNMSLALIDEPGKGRHWVKPSSKVGHLQIEQIKDGLIVVKGSQETFEIAIEESTVQDSSTIPRRTGSLSGFKPTLPVSGGSTYSAATPSVTLSTKEAPDDEERDARAKALIEKLRNLQKDVISDQATGIDDKDKAARIERLISQYQSTRISPEEAKKLGNLGRTLKDTDSDPNRSASDPNTSP
jgi:hypothetical protein